MSEGSDGQRTLRDLFTGSRQLIVKHVMFGPDWENPCTRCQADVDEMTAAQLRHLRSRDTAFVLVSRAPYDKIAAAAERLGWFIPWCTYSAFARGTEFLGNSYTFLDLTVLGRQEDWEEPKDRVPPVRGGDPTFTS